MGQYHTIHNLTRHEMLHPHALGDGVKLLEFGCSGQGTLTALTILLAASCKGGGRGGGDFDSAHPMAKVLVGRWAGDCIAIIGDYAEEGDIPGWTRAQLEYARENDVDISGFMRDLMKTDGSINISSPWGSSGNLKHIVYDAETDTFKDTEKSDDDNEQS